MGYTVRKIVKRKDRLSLFYRDQGTLGTFNNTDEVI